MDRTSFETAPCSIARSVDVLGDWWTPLIIRECLYGVERFDVFQRVLGIGRNMLTRRLNRLVEQDILEKHQYQERPARYGYRLTERGFDAAKVLLAMMPFGERWLFEGGEPIHLFDRRTGRRVRPRVVDAETGDELDPRQLYAGPGPVFPKSREIRRSRFAEYYERAPERRRG